jgi:hypothetical protein
MRRAEFDHVIAAAAEVADETELVVIGSQAILGSFPNAPDGMLHSMEVDLYPRTHPERADDIDGSIGDGSWFHRTYGYYGHGVGPETAKAPAGWGERLVVVEVPIRISSRRRVVALCMEPHDLVLAKCVAGRERDWEFAREALQHGLVGGAVLSSRIDDLPVDEEDRRRVRETLEAIAGRVT